MTPEMVLAMAWLIPAFRQWLIRELEDEMRAEIRRQFARIEDQIEMPK